MSPLTINYHRRELPESSLFNSYATRSVAVPRDGAGGKGPACQHGRCKRGGCNPWEEMPTHSRIPAWRFHGQRGLGEDSPRGCKEPTQPSTARNVAITNLPCTRIMPKHPLLRGNELQTNRASQRQSCLATAIKVDTLSVLAASVGQVEEERYPIPL